MFPVPIYTKLFNSFHGSILFGAFYGIILAFSGNFLINKNIYQILFVVACSNFLYNNKFNAFFLFLCPLAGGGA